MEGTPRGAELRRIGRVTLTLILLQFAAWGELRFNGKVLSDTGTPIAGARIVLKGSTVVSCNSDASGSFRCALPGAGDYSLEVEREGYFVLKNSQLKVDADTSDVLLTLNRVREIVQNVDVTANPGAIDEDRTAPQIALSGNDILNVPYPTTNTLRNAFRIMPGMVEDSRGGVHLHGGAEEQTLYTLEGFQINDPLTGRFDARLSVEGVSSLEATGGRPSAEFGKASAGVLAIRTRTGDDKWRTSATNFVPGVEHQKGLMIGSWNPRANISGPWKPGRAWFSNSMDLQYVSNVIPELPKGMDRNSSWRWSNSLHNQINLAPSAILTVGSLINYWFAPRTGLSAIDAPETTVDRRARQWFTYAKLQKYFSRGAVVELGYANNRTFGREIPQGRDFYVVTPAGKFGNNFLDATRKGGRDEFLANGFLPTTHFAGEHQFKVGLNVSRLFYNQRAERTGIEFTTIDMRPVRRTLFEGNGAFERSNLETALYVQDSWRLRPNLLIELGVRNDWDRLVRNWNTSPRLGFAWSPFQSRKTRISGGFARMFDATSLRLFTRPLDQYSVSTYFQPDGTIERGPALTLYQINEHLTSPRYSNWNLSIEHAFPKGLQGRMNFIRRRGSHGYTYLNFEDGTNPAFDALYQLTSQRADNYGALEITLRQPIRQQYEWMVSYTRSRARSNAVVDQSIDEPLFIGNNAGSLPWDAPNRWLSWGHLPSPWPNWSVAYLVEWRSGYPFSVQNPQGQVVGVNELRYPVFFEFNLHIERRVKLRGQWWAVRGGFNNITNHKNPNVVNNVIGSPLFLRMYGGQSRAFNVRVRWLGRG